MQRTLLVTVLTTSSLLAACGDGVVDPGTGPGDDVVDPTAPADDSPLADGADIVAVPRTVDVATRVARLQRLAAAGAPVARPPAGDDFYLAIKKSALASTWCPTPSR